jgi:putative membrane protein
MGYCCGGFLGWGGGIGSLGPILGLLALAGFLAVLGGGMIWAIRRGNTSSEYRGSRVEPLEIARQRLASGEITTEEFEEIRRRIQS